MAEVVVPLGTTQIRGLITGLKELSRSLRDDTKVEIEKTVAGMVATEVRSNLAAIQDPDGNYAGFDGMPVNVQPAVGDGHEVVWRGAQIAYLEFGTGEAGAIGDYPGDAMARAGYHPDPTKWWWVYKDAKLGPRVSQGLAPQAPMYNAARLLGSGVLRDISRRLVRGAIDRAITVR